MKEDVCNMRKIVKDQVYSQRIETEKSVHD